jgi:hypothetical protein
LITDQIFALILEDADEPRPAVICFSEDVDIENQDGMAFGRRSAGVKTLQRSYAMTGMVMPFPLFFSRNIHVWQTSAILQLNCQEGPSTVDTGNLFTFFSSSMPQSDRA